MNFSQELKTIIGSISIQPTRNIISNNDLNALQREFENISPDFITYLGTVGSGDLIESSIKIYSSLLDFSDFGLDEVYSVDDSIKFFGDNYAGDFFGFDLANKKDEVIEFWHDSNSIHSTGKSFREFILQNTMGKY